MNTVRIARVPGLTTVIELPANATIADALIAADITLTPNESVYMNAAFANAAQLTDTVLYHDQRATLLVLKPSRPITPHDPRPRRAESCNPQP